MLVYRNLPSRPGAWLRIGSPPTELQKDSVGAFEVMLSSARVGSSPPPTSIVPSTVTAATVVTTKFSPDRSSRASTLTRAAFAYTGVPGKYVGTRLTGEARGV